MTRIFISDSNYDELSALRLMLQDLKMEIVGESSDWLLTLAEINNSNADLILVDWKLLPAEPADGFSALKKASPHSLVVALINNHDAGEEVALSAGADAIISKGDTPERTAERLLDAAEGNLSRIFHSSSQTDKKVIDANQNTIKNQKEFGDNFLRYKSENLGGRKNGNLIV